MKHILITGAFGQIGSELVPALQQTYGVENVIAMGHNTLPKDFKGITESGDIRDYASLTSLIKRYNIDTIFHLVSLLSAKGEKDPVLTWDINMNGLLNVLNAAREHNLQIFWPSSIAAFGPTTPKDHTPQQTVLEPTTMYGVTKVAGELLCQYYFQKYGVDVRSVRYPGIISWKTPPGGGTSDYAVAIFYEGIQKGTYDSFVNKQTVIPMMYVDDAIAATIKIMETDAKNITVRTSYNLAAISFTMEELVKEIQKHIPITVSYHPDFRQQIADSWPNSIDDSSARNDWHWKHTYDLSTMTAIMIKELKTFFQKG